MTNNQVNKAYVNQGSEVNRPFLVFGDFVVVQFHPGPEVQVHGGFRNDKYSPPSVHTVSAPLITLRSLAAYMRFIRATPVGGRARVETFRVQSESGNVKNRVVEDQRKYVQNA